MSHGDKQRYKNKLVFCLHFNCNQLCRPRPSTMGRVSVARALAGLRSIRKINYFVAMNL